MEQFSLEKWLQNKSRKVVTRDGRSVRIICYDAKRSTPIIALLTTTDGEEHVFSYNEKGRIAIDEPLLDLFFADEEEELTEFEKEIINIVFKYKYWDNSSKDEVKQHIKKDSKLLLDLARKEIRKEQQEKLGTLEMPIDVTEPYYIKGKQDALKDLPKLKNAGWNYKHPFVDINQPEPWLYYRELGINIEELFEKLPKE